MVVREDSLVPIAMEALINVGKLVLENPQLHHYFICKSTQVDSLMTVRRDRCKASYALEQ